jgi:hypothetical protein
MAGYSQTENVAPLDLSKWRPVPLVLMVLGGIGVLIGLCVPSLRPQFLFSWLTAYMFYLSLVLGGMFMVIVHHLTDANWSVPIRRISENIACLSWVMPLLFIPQFIFPGQIWEWWNIPRDEDHALNSKYPLLTHNGFYIAAAICFLAWIFFSFQLRACSLAQDKDGAAKWTKKMRVLSSFGIIVFALSFTMASIMWIKALQHEWFSTMFGVWYFAAGTWLTLATIYVITMTMKRLGPLRQVAGVTQFYFIGSLFFAFTVFYSYVTFAQYFIIWNANIPEETFWYNLRENGTWYQLGIFIIFAHFFVPFLLLLRIDAKLYYPLMLFIAVWSWLVHYIDMQFNIMPAFHKDTFWLHWLDFACMMFMGGVLAKIFIASTLKHPPYPQRDPRLSETLGIYPTTEPAPQQQVPSSAHPA